MFTPLPRHAAWARGVPPTRLYERDYIYEGLGLQPVLEQLQPK